VPGSGGTVVDSWSESWREALPRRTADEQARLRDAACRAVADLRAAAQQVEGRTGRALHRRALHVTTHARLEVAPDIPTRIALGPLTPGASWPAMVRFSNAYPLSRPDVVPDQRGLAVRVADGARRLDLLATTGEAHHARDGRAMIASLGAALAAMRGGIGGRIGALLTLVRALGPGDALRLARTVSGAADAGVSLAALTFYSRGHRRPTRRSVRPPTAGWAETSKSGGARARWPGNSRCRASSIGSARRSTITASPGGRPGSPWRG
jgi:hypothetical protein